MTIANQINYVHARNTHTLEGAKRALSIIFRSGVPASLLDVGAGTGTWLRAAFDLGITDCLGIDGIMADEQLHVPKETIRIFDLRQSFDLGRRYDVAISLEVAEHLPASSAETLINSIVRHSDKILFSAAIPGQAGDHHINCQWPDYWQALFNKRGFFCDDSARWAIWDDPLVEPWYRQNMFWAHRDHDKAGNEPRVRRIVHPDMTDIVSDSHSIRRAEDGVFPLKWYLTGGARAVKKKFHRTASRILK